jgi:hypothetical protein
MKHVVAAVAAAKPRPSSVGRQPLRRQSQESAANNSHISTPSGPSLNNVQQVCPIGPVVFFRSRFNICKSVR